VKEFACRSWRRYGESYSSGLQATDVEERRSRS
jgi:hypothetical protein